MMPSFFKNIVSLYDLLIFAASAAADSIELGVCPNYEIGCGEVGYSQCFEIGKCAEFLNFCSPHNSVAFVKAERQTQEVTLNFYSDSDCTVAMPIHFGDGVLSTTFQGACDAMCWEKTPLESSSPTIGAISCPASCDASEASSQHHLATTLMILLPGLALLGI